VNSCPAVSATHPQRLPIILRSLNLPSNVNIPCESNRYLLKQGAAATDNCTASSDITIYADAIIAGNCAGRSPLIVHGRRLTDITPTTGLQIINVEDTQPLLVVTSRSLMLTQFRRQTLQ
jgi:hypothetical protein